MSAFNEDFQTDTPTGQSIASDIDIFINAQTKEALNERLKLEHFDLETAGTDTTNENAQGRHKAGYVGTWGKGTSATMRAILTAGIGAFWEITDTDTGESEAPAGTMFRFESGTGWTPAQFGQGAIYATPVEVATLPAVEDKAISPATLRQADLRYEAIDNGGPVTPGVGSIDTVYQIADFTGPGDLDVTNITGLYITCDLFTTTGDDNHVKATWPDGTSHVLLRSQTVGTTQQHMDATILVPINRETLSITINTFAVIISPTFTIIGAEQRTYEVPA